MAMLHQSKEVNGVEKMLPVKSVTVKPHGTLKFEPGSYHVMCMKPNMALGQSVPMTLEILRRRHASPRSFRSRARAGSNLPSS